MRRESPIVHVYTTENTAIVHIRQLIYTDDEKERNLFTPTKRYNKWTSQWGERIWLYQEDAKQESYGQGT